MMKKTDSMIGDLLERQKLLQKQTDVQNAIIITKDQKIRLLEQEVTLLDEHNKRLSEEIRRILKINEGLEEICIRQQALLDEFSKMMG